MTEVLIPDDLWSDGEEAAISAWLYESGDQVATGSVVAEIMVEKSSFELLAPASGILEILVDAEISVVKNQKVGRISHVNG